VLEVPDAIVLKLDRSGRPMNYGAPTYPRVECRDRPDPGGRAVEVLMPATPSASGRDMISRIWIEDALRDD
jgi:hypothetical protein